MQIEHTEKKYAIALGYFDGLHLAHSQVLGEALKFSEKDMLPAVLIFDEHPRKVLFGDKVSFLLQSDKRDEKLSEQGFHILRVKFSEIMDLSPEAFVRDVLIGKFGAGALISGYNYSFGKNSGGNSAMLTELGKSYGVDVLIVPAMLSEGEPVSSTRIRIEVENGRIAEANRLLGYPFTFRAPVFSGDKRGRLLGAPTINQYLPDGLAVPRFGVYASKVYFDGKCFDGVTNIGSRPTFDGVSVRSETYIIDYKGDLYGKTVDVELYEFIRDEKKFSDVSELIRQIESDVLATEKYFAEN